MGLVQDSWHGVKPALGVYRYAADFAVDGDIRFLSHNDMVRLFSRACARAGLPVCFTKGFNPRRRLSLPFPRPVGQYSDAERLLVDLHEEVSSVSLVERFQLQMPTGIILKGATLLAPSDSCQPKWVRYRIASMPTDVEALASRAESLLASDSIDITRVRHKDGRSKVVNIRPFIDTIDVLPNCVNVSVYVTSLGSATPIEVCGALGMKADAINCMVHRVEIQWHESQLKQQTIK